MFREFSPQPDDADPTVGMSWLKRQLGRTDYRATRFVRYVELLIDQQGFPPPLPTLRTSRGGQLIDGVVPESKWRRAAVLAWLEDFLPPANAGQLAAAEARTAATDMDAAAAGLRLLQGGRA